MLPSLVVLFTAIALVFGYQDGPGDSCGPSYSPCSYSFTDNDGSFVTVLATCAPDGYCADDGALCDTDDNCYNSCGSDGVCGGVGAFCTTSDPFSNGQYDVACNTPSDICDLENAVCIMAASQGSKNRTKRAQDRKLAKKRDACTLGMGFDLCMIETSRGLQANCVDTFSRGDACGGCLINADGSKGTGMDCDLVQGAEFADCVLSSCSIISCLDGFALVENECVRF